MSADAEPDWAEVAAPGSGEYAWHDHRPTDAASDPVGARRGIRSSTEVLPIVVDGVAVEVRIESTWMPVPSRWPTVLGRIRCDRVVGGAAGTDAARMGTGPRRRRWIAAAVGWIGYASLPELTDPRPVWWLLPVLAVAFAIAAWVLGPTPGGHAAAAIAGLELTVWALDRRAGLTRAVFRPTRPTGSIGR